MKTKANATFTRSLLQAIVAMVCFLGAQWLLNLIYEVFLIGAFKNLPGESLKAIYSLGTLLLTVAGAFPLFCIVMKVKPKDLWRMFKPKNSQAAFNDAWQYLVIALGIASIPVLMQAFLTVGNRLDPSLTSSLTAMDILVTIITSIIVMPLVEEMMFRGVMLNHFLQYGTTAAVVASSFIFALGHLNLINTIVSLPIGFILGYAALRTGSLCLPLLIHIITNLFGSLIAPKMMENGVSIPFYIATGFALVAVLAAIALTLTKRVSLFSVPNDDSL